MLNHSEVPFLTESLLQSGPLAGRTKLVLGCGKDNEKHNHIHSPQAWVSLDVKQHIKPDIVIDLLTRNLKSALTNKAMLPVSGYDVIYAEGLPTFLFELPVFQENLQALLHDEGILLIDNLSVSELTNFKGHFANHFAFFGNAILTKQPMDINVVLKKLLDAQLYCDRVEKLVSDLMEVVQVRNKMQISDLQTQQFIPGYILLKRYNDIIAQQYISQLVHNLHARQQAFPEWVLQGITKKTLTYLVQEPILYNYLLIKSSEIQEEDRKDFLAWINAAEIDKQLVDKAFLALELVPHIFELIDSDDSEYFLKKHRQDHSTLKKVYNFFKHGQQKIYSKGHYDQLLNFMLATFDQLLSLNDITKLAMFSKLMHLHETEFLPLDKMKFNPNLERAVIEWTYYLHARFIYACNTASFDFVYRAEIAPEQQQTSAYRP